MTHTHLYRSFSGGLALGILLLSQAHASHIKIINENDCSLSIEITPENIFGTTPCCQATIMGVSENPNKSFGEYIITSDNLQGSEYFSVSAKIGGILFGDTCRYLHVSRNYEIYFHNTFWGTTCDAKEIPGAPFFPIFEESTCTSSD